MDVVPATPANLGNGTSSPGPGEFAAQVYPAAEREAAGPRPERFQVLALDGGGAKALFTAHVLARLEQDLGVRITDSFDLIAGTSAGGIVALGLGAGLTPKEIVSHYEELVEKVFPASRRRGWRRPRQLRSPIYDAEALRQALTGVLGARLLGDSTKRLVIPAWDVQRGTCTSSRLRTTHG
ncbi:patatin-like phospholipase family protein [Mycobacteroides abscessus]